MIERLTDALHLQVVPRFKLTDDELTTLTGRNARSATGVVQHLSSHLELVEAGLRRTGVALTVVAAIVSFIVVLGVGWLLLGLAGRFVQL